MSEIGNPKLNLLVSERESSFFEDEFPQPCNWCLMEILEAIGTFNTCTDLTAREMAISLYCREVGLPKIKLIHIELSYLASKGGAA